MENMDRWATQADGTLVCQHNGQVFTYTYDGQVLMRDLDQGYRACVLLKRPYADQMRTYWDAAQRDDLVRVWDIPFDAVRTSWSERIPAEAEAEAIQPSTDTPDDVQERALLAYLDNQAYGRVMERWLLTADEKRAAERLVARGVLVKGKAEHDARFTVYSRP